MFKLKDYQKEALKKIRDGNILKGQVGSGKSLVSLAYYFESCGGEILDNKLKDMTSPLDLFIITTAFKRNKFEWDIEMSRFLLSTHKEKCHYNITIVVDSWNNIKKYVNVKNSFFIFDEQKVTGNGVWVKSFYKITANNRWILLSATPGDVWEDYIPIFVANGFYKNKTEFAREHIIYNPFRNYPSVMRYINIDKLEFFKNKITVIMKKTDKVFQIFNDEYLDYDKELYAKVQKERWDVFSNKPIETGATYCQVLRRIVNSNPSRIIRLKELYLKHNKIIVFYNFNYERDILVNFAESEKISYAQLNGHKHQNIPSGEQWLYFVNYGSGSEAWNCILTNTMVMFSTNYSYKIMAQAYGRIDRPNTLYKDLYYYIFTSESSIDKRILNALNKKEKFNEEKFAENDHF